MKRTIFIVLCCLAVVFSAGCSRSYSKDLLGSYEELERIMSVYSAQPDKLMPALDDYIARNREVWCRVVEAESRVDSDTIDRDYSMNEKQIVEILKKILNLDLVIQDNLRDDPEALRAYMQRVANIGC